VKLLLGSSAMALPLSAFRGSLLQSGSGRRWVNRIKVCLEAVGTASNDIRSFVAIYERSMEAAAGGNELKIVEESRPGVL